MPEDTIYQIEDWLRTRDPKKLEIPENLKTYLAVQEWSIKLKRAVLDCSTV